MISSDQTSQILRSVCQLIPVISWQDRMSQAYAWGKRRIRFPQGNGNICRILIALSVDKIQMANEVET